MRFYEDYSELYNEDGSFFLEDNNFNSCTWELENVLNESIENCLIENYELFTEALAHTEKSFINGLNVEMRNITKLVEKRIKQIGIFRRANNKPLERYYLSRLRSYKIKLDKRIGLIKEDIRLGQWGSAMKRIYKNSDVRFLSKEKAAGAIIRTAGVAALFLPNIVEKIGVKRLASHEKVRDAIKSYISWGTSLSAKIGSFERNI